MAKFILSIDGGGIRGLIPAVILVELERRLAASGRSKPIAHYFDLIAGTSTGGIIAAGLTCPKGKTRTTPACTASDLVDLYEKEGGEIFNRGFFIDLRRTLTNPGSAFDERYDAAPLEAKLKARLGDRRLSEAIAKVVITAYDITKREARFLTNGLQRDGEDSDDYLFREVARATSAAPTYFEPALVQNISKKRSEALIDGGVFANDPTLAAVFETRKLGFDENELHILSLGTGENTRGFAYADARNWGALGWIDPARGAPIVSILMQGQSSTTSYQMKRLFGPRYLRLDCKLDDASDDLDDASPANLAGLRREAEKIISESSAELDAFIALLPPP